MADIGTNPIILWDTLKLSANPLWARGDVLVVAHVKVQRRGHEGPDEYRVNFELNRHHGLVSHDVEVWVWPTGGDVPFWRYSGRRDIVVAIKDHFLTTHLYAYVAGQLGWIPTSGVSPTDAPLDP